MLFWVEDSGGPRNHVLDGGPDPPIWRGSFEPIVKYRDTLQWAVQKWRDVVWVVDLDGPRNHVLDSPGEGAVLKGKGRPTVKYRDALQWAVQKWLNRSRCRLGWTMIWVGPRNCESGWVHTDVTWRIPMNHPCAVATRPFWSNCKPEGTLFSAEFVCLSVFLTGTSTLQH